MGFKIFNRLKNIAELVQVREFGIQSRSLVLPTPSHHEIVLRGVALPYFHQVYQPIKSLKCLSATGEPSYPKSAFGTALRLGRPILGRFICSHLVLARSQCYAVPGEIGARTGLLKSPIIDVDGSYNIRINNIVAFHSGSYSPSKILQRKILR